MINHKPCFSILSVENALGAARLNFFLIVIFYYFSYLQEVFQLIKELVQVGAVVSDGFATLLMFFTQLQHSI